MSGVLNIRMQRIYVILKKCILYGYANNGYVALNNYVWIPAPHYAKATRGAARAGMT